MPGTRTTLIGLSLMLFAGCARTHSGTGEAVACFRGTGLDRSVGQGVTSSDGPATLILDSIVEPGREERHARLAVGPVARYASWKPDRGDTINVAVTGVFPPAVYTLEHEGTGLAGRGRPLTEMPGAEGVDTTSWAVSLAAVPCAPALAALEPGASRPPLPEAVRTELVIMGDSDQAVRRGMTVQTFSDTAFLRSMTRSDSKRTERLRDVIARWGWPSPSRAGETAAGGAFLVLQHSPLVAFQRRMLPVLDSLVHVGEVDPQNFALLTDRVLKRQGLPQRFGSQFDVKNGVFALYPIADSANVEARRAALGIMPLSAYAAFVKKMYAPGGR